MHVPRLSKLGECIHQLSNPVIVCRKVQFQSVSLIYYFILSPRPISKRILTRMHERELSASWMTYSSSQKLRLSSRPVNTDDRVVFRLRTVKG